MLETLPGNPVLYARKVPSAIYARFPSRCQKHDLSASISFMGTAAWRVWAVGSNDWLLLVRNSCNSGADGDQTIELGILSHESYCLHLLISFSKRFSSEEHKVLSCAERQDQKTITH